MKTEIKPIIQTLDEWVVQRRYQGYDPGDGLTSFLRPLTLGNILAERILQQLIWKLPINLRPLVGVRPLDSTKGRGFMAWGYVLLHRITRDPVYRARAYDCLHWLDRNREQGHAGHCWGNHFDFTTRGGRMLAHTPTIVWSGLIGQAFFDAYDEFAEPAFLAVGESICNWILSLPRETTAEGSCLSYVPEVQSSIHNSNLLGAGLLARMCQHRNREDLRTTAREAALYSCARQRADGSWWYGETPKHHWIDNFHTAYNLDSLKRYSSYTGDRSFDSNILRGYEYFKRTFFRQDGRPVYYHDREYPIDIQCAAQAIDTFALFHEFDPEALQYAERIAAWTIANLRSPSGYFYYRRYPLLIARTPYFHWGQATMFKSLSHLLYRRTLRSESSSRPPSQTSTR